MSGRRVSVGAALLLVTALAGGARAQMWGARGGDRSGPSDGAAVRAVIEAVFRATEGRDFAALDTLYAGDDLTVVEGAGIDRGWATYRDHHLKPELSRFRAFTYRPSEIEVHVAGDVAWALFRYELRIEMEGRTVDNVGRGTAILERREGRWRIRHLQTASRPRRRDPEPGAP